MLRRSIMDDHLSQEVLDFVVENAPFWFPELAGNRVRLSVEHSIRRERSSLAFLRIEGGPGRPVRVVVKAELKDAPALDDRPRLGIGPHDVSGKHHLEWKGLVTAWEEFGTGRHPGLGAARPLAHLPEARTLIVSRVEDPTLRTQLVASSRLRVGRRRPDLLPAVYGLGRWLGAFHRLGPAVERVRETPEQRAGAAEGYARFLSRRHPAAAELADRLVDLQPDLDPTIPLGLGHGDFAPRNAFISAEGEVTVIDILARWRVPIYEDIAFLLVELRMAGPELLLLGHAFPAEHHRQLEESFLQGYVAETEVAVDRGALAWHLALILVDKWAAAVTRASGRGRDRVRWHLVNRRLEDETARVSAELRARVG